MSPEDTPTAEVLLVACIISIGKDFLVAYGIQDYSVYDKFEVLRPKRAIQFSTRTSFCTAFFRNDHDVFVTH